MSGTPSADPAPEILASARSGEPAALESLARWCYPRVYRWALVRTGDHDEADDVTQDVVAMLAGRLRTYEGRSRFTTWLYRVTANAAGHRLRRRLRRLTLLRGAPPAPPPRDEEAERLGALHAADVAALVRSLLRELPERQRTVFDLADLQGLDAAEIAERMMLEPVTVRSHLMRARRAMRSRILARMPGLAGEGS